MKKWGYLLAILTVIVGIAACNPQQTDVKEKTNGTKTSDVNKSNKETANQNNGQESTGNSTTNQNQPESSVPAPQVYQNEIFNDVAVTQSGDEIVVTGKAQVFEGMFNYALYDGEKLLLENSYQTEGAPAWGEFRITFKKAIVTSNQVKLQLFDYSAKDGSKINILEIPIPKS